MPGQDVTTSRDADMRARWETSFAEQIDRGAYNTAPVEAIVRNIAYYLRDRYDDAGLQDLRCLEIGCGAGPNLLWCAAKGARVSGVDIAPTALKLTRQTLAGADLEDHLVDLVEASASDVPLADSSYDVIIEACVFQHLDREDRRRAFAEVDRLIRPGGLFVGYMLHRDHTVFERNVSEQLADDPGTLELREGGSNVYLTNIGLSHFFAAAELRELLPEWTTVDPCPTTYELPREEAARRGYDTYRQCMLAVYAVK